MREVAGSGIAAVPVPLLQLRHRGLPLRFPLPPFFPLPLSLPFPFPTWLVVPFASGSVLMDLSFFASTGWIYRAMASDSAAVAAHLASARLSMSIHDGEARVPFLSAPLIHLFSPSLCKLIDADELKAKFGIVRQVIYGIICPCTILTVGDGFKVSSLAVFPQPC
jgi:hypothetical protein